MKKMSVIFISLFDAHGSLAVVLNIQILFQFRKLDILIIVPTFAIHFRTLDTLKKLLS